MYLKSNYLTFEVNEEANRAAFVLDGKESTKSAEADFWRLILDDGLRTEIPVISAQQKGRVTERDGALVIEYDKLVSEYGDEYDVYFKITVECADGLLRFTPYIENRQEARVNECFCPLADFTELFGEKSKDVIYMPNGLGTRVTDPWTHMESMTRNYYAHDDREAFWHLPYPRATMGWFGIESDGKFLYVGRHDDRFRFCFMTVKHRIHSTPSNLMLGIDHLPMAKKGECLELPSSTIGVIDGGWRAAADYYRAWADATFFRVVEKEKWVREMTGWQRIIMRSQYGEDYYKASDLPRVYLEGAKRGIHTIFLFAWWKEGMDRNYPIYTEPYEGAWAELKENIAKVREMGGRVILECNCHFLDPHTDYYKEFGEELVILDINGNEYRPSFVYPGRGELRAAYGSHQFPIVCAGTQRWRDQFASQFKLMNDEMQPDCLFADCYGGCPHQPCFNTRHDHGNRVDQEWIYHRMIFEDAEKYCAEQGKVFAAEVVTDIAASYTQFIHGLVNVDFQIKSSQFPALFRYTFPEVITTERGIRCPEGDYFKQLKYSLCYGVRLDAELYVCRADLGRDEKYAEAIAFYTEHLDKYGEFYYYGSFTVLDTGELPYYIKRTEYYDADGSRVMRVLYNASRDTQSACGVTLAPDEMRYDIFGTDEYVKMLAK